MRWEMLTVRDLLISVPCMILWTPAVGGSGRSAVLFNAGVGGYEREEGRGLERLVGREEEEEGEGRLREGWRVRMWVVRLEDWAKALGQKEQEKGFSPVWVRMWRVRRLG